MSSVARRTERLSMLMLGLAGALLIVIGLMVALLLVPAVAAAAPGRGVQPQAAADLIEVGDQPIDPDVDTATIARVVSAQGGWIVVYADQGGSPGTQLGQTAVPQGETLKVTVMLSENVRVNAKLWAKLHIDGGTKGTFEFPGPDSPVFVNSKAVEASFIVAPEGLPNTGATTSSPALVISAAMALLAGAWLRLRAARAASAR